VRKGTTLKGWKWGTQDRVRSWGENLVAGAVNGGSGIGQVLKFTFNRQGTSGAQYNEGALSNGDSAGGVFIYDGGKWKLAGINYLVDGPFSLSGANGTGFNGSIFDKGGLYQGGDGRWTYNYDAAADIPGNWYATRISSRQSWIKSIIGTTTTTAAREASLTSSVAVPEPAGFSLLALGAAAMLQRRRR
jgi:MYXO-CTERM domain-containing protein